jgi:hypothetical protein
MEVRSTPFYGGITEFAYLQLFSPHSIAKFGAGGDRSSPAHCATGNGLAAELESVSDT